MDSQEPSFERLRAEEYGRLDAGGHAYLDYTGSGLYAASQLRAQYELLSTHVLGNPHSENPSSRVSTELVNAARQRVLRFFEADPEEYEVCFTANATGALKLVGESYPFEADSRFVLTADNHNSVNGIREFAERRGASVEYLPLDHELRLVDPDRVLPDAAGSAPSLFAYPAQSNFSGVQHPLALVDLAHHRGYDVVLDAAAFVPTNPLSLRQVRPEFVAVSFYKMFGYPTGVGALIARRNALSRLRRPWFAGGTVRFVSAQNRRYLLKGDAEGFEDGTPNFLAIAALPAGFDLLDRVGMQRIHEHVKELTALLLRRLSALKHGNGRPLLDLFGPRYDEARGGTIAFNVLDATGAEVAYQVVDRRATEAGISVRTGCFCNPGAAEFAFGFRAAETERCFTTLTPEEFTLERFSHCMADATVGAVRASLGIASTVADVDRFIAVLEGFRDYVAEGGERKHLAASIP